MVKKEALSLSRFMLRTQVLKLYRDIFRLIKNVPDKSYREQLKEWARHDFKANKHHTDEMAIKMLLTKGKMTYDEVHQAIDMSK
ncbi:hypothetical protein LOTGIDRAFT_210328 [Lottia gigantea]|uniref:LYR motif-containing protein 2 n=1 Tax=Lottia gigantea TaxID=225164 RepID=V3ZDV0_LOTGI|nr:hypothetical protein LOTGIDRAFT_210328 [Lottia gigantea]ESO89293.1 hypothetical protein LOTGIDRAFT_210328 [Lottia gigantea]